MRRSDSIMLVCGAIVGALVLLLGLGALLDEGDRLALIGLLLPLAVLIGGLVWAYDAASNATAVEEARPVAPSPAQPLPVLLGDPSAVDAPTVLPAVEPDDGEVSEAARLRAAQGFPLDSFLLDEVPDRIQCHRCGRYGSLIRAAGPKVSCSACGAARTVGDVQPDTSVRLFTDDPVADHATVGPDGGPPAAAPTEMSAARTDAPSRFAPPPPRGG